MLSFKWSWSIGIYEILGSRDVWDFLDHQHHRPPQSSHCYDEPLLSGIVVRPNQPYSHWNWNLYSRDILLTLEKVSFKTDSQTFQLISVSSEKADTEWKFARSKLWISYFKVFHADDNGVDDGDIDWNYDEDGKWWSRWWWLKLLLEVYICCT